MPQDGQNAKFQYAPLAAASVHSWTEPNLLGEVATRQTGDFWRYVMYAAFACIRTASRAGIAVRQARQDLNEPSGAITIRRSS